MKAMGISLSASGRENFQPPKIIERLGGRKLYLFFNPRGYKRESNHAGVFLPRGTLIK